LAWNNPRLHPAERRKTWLACDEHRQSLTEFLDSRGFLREVNAMTPNAQESPTTPNAQESPTALTAQASWVGALARIELTVTDADTAQAIGSGDVPVLATPRVLALVEAATVAATTRKLVPGTTTVGTRIELEHSVATPVGRTVTAQARLTAAEGRRLRFAVSVNEGTVVVAEGTVERVLVDRKRFLAKVTGSG
jgi:fluoroacetyl-CoA thioesterase